MGFYALLTLLACVVLFCKDASSLIISSIIAVQGFESYHNVRPFKYDVPTGTSRITFTVQTSRSSITCAAKTVTVLIQYGGLPLVIETNKTFPDSFIVDKPTIVWHMKAEQGDYLPMRRPAPGPWFLIVFTEKTDKAIKQKGLNDDDDVCAYFFSTRMDFDKTVTSTVIDYREKHEVNIRTDGTKFRFNIPTSTMSFDIKLTKCDPSPCNITMTYFPYQWADTSTVTCTNSVKDCVMHVSSPNMTFMQFFELKNDGVNQNQKVTFSIDIAECTTERSRNCTSTEKLSRAETSSQLYTTLGMLVQNRIVLVSADLQMAPIVVIPFEILDPNDIGGTLKWTMISISNALENQMIIQICGTLLHNYLPEITSGFNLCTNMSNGIMQNFTSASEDQPSLYVPYPKAGFWHIILQATCFDVNRTSEIPCQSSINLIMSVNIQRCVDGGCTDKGTCTLGALSSDIIAFAACQCDAKYQGYACTDDTNAQSVSVQLAGAYLLTMSNLFFIPAIVIAVRRRYFVEAFVYFYNMFFSTFYHACDGMRLQKYRLCITDYDVLQVADFFGSSCSLWFTLIAMARIRYQHIVPVLQIMGPFSLLIGVIYDKTSLYVIAVPIGCGLLVIVLSWGFKMCRRKKLYPSWRRYLFFLFPGLVLAAVGAAVFSFLETEDNYKYVHSVWHICIASSICFFLPPRRSDEYKKHLSESDTPTQLLTPSVTQTSLEIRAEINTGFVNDES